MPDSVEIIWLLLCAACCAACIAGLKRMMVNRSWLLDQPNHRSLHDSPVPRVGGLAIWLAAALASAGAGHLPPWPVVLGLGLSMLISLIDDWRSQPVVTRLSIHLISACFIVLWLRPETAVLVVAIPAVVWAGNLFNFMDGLDGLAGSMAVIGFCALGWGAGLAGHPSAFPAFAIASASAIFLFFNLPPARVFMGDAGSVPLGMAAAGFGLWGWHDGAWPWWFPLLVFMPFALDATWTLLARTLRGQQFWLAHREHLYQRLVLGGWAKGKVLRAGQTFMLACGVLALILLAQRPHHQLAGFILACLLLATIYGITRNRVAAPEN